MRIISGQFKGLQNKSAIPIGVRPTTDKNREIIFNILNNYIDFDGLNVLDLCAGTGFMGFEAISRGAKFCTFIEKSKKTCDFIKKSFLNFKINTEYYEILEYDVLKYLNNLKTERKYSLVFFDPPYNLNISNQVINLIDNCDNILNEAVICFEHGLFEHILKPNSWSIISNKTEGESILDIFIKN